MAIQRTNEKKTLTLLMPTTPTATTNLDRNGKKCLQIIYFERWSLLTPFNPFYLGNNDTCLMSTIIGQQILLGLVRSLSRYFYLYL
jgi:hypothetical protein